MGLSPNGTAFRGLRKTFKDMMHVQDEAETLIARSITVIRQFDFDRLAYGRAAHSHLLRILDLESSLETLVPCVVSERTRYALMGIATFDPDVKKYWVRVLGENGYLREDVLRGTIRRSGKKEARSRKTSA